MGRNWKNQLDAEVDSKTSPLPRSTFQQVFCLRGKYSDFRDSDSSSCA
ncbi:rCG37037 [Rattus norvegicus]|uniref:RCG37037 n=1 Tax=Rattus norvegicus TaxID=10116 RepID=A6HU35_RAT|nr:rCG37037 [Rattus norvegicus]